MKSTENQMKQRYWINFFRNVSFACFTAELAD